jgi:hypothetical protein
MGSRGTLDSEQLDLHSSWIPLYWTWASMYLTLSWEAAVSSPVRPRSTPVPTDIVQLKGSEMLCLVVSSTEDLVNLLSSTVSGSCPPWRRRRAPLESRYHHRPLQKAPIDTSCCTKSFILACSGSSRQRRASSAKPEPFPLAEHVNLCSKAVSITLTSRLTAISRKPPPPTSTEQSRWFRARNRTAVHILSGSLSK